MGQASVSSVLNFSFDKTAKNECKKFPLLEASRPI